jgi:murein DD-endopeptidase MepM/ murein hydrolase activator NlpD
MNIGNREVCYLSCMKAMGYKLTRWVCLTILLICLILIFSLPVIGSAQASNPVYIVQQGDTLYIIAQRFGTSVDAIAAANGITDPALIAPGMELIIPGYQGVSGVLDFHELGFGETTLSVSAQFGISPDAIIKLNGILRPDRLYIGQAMIITVPSDGDSSIAMNLNLAEVGESKLAFAARNGVNPWSLSYFGDWLDRAWIISNEPINLPGVAPLVSSIPDPIKNVAVIPERAVQGQTLEMIITADNNLPITGRMGDQQLSFHSSEDHEWVSLQGIDALAEPGMYDLELSIWDTQYEKIRYSFVQPLRVTDGGYYYDPVLSVPEETVNSETSQVENALVDSIVNQFTAERYWEGLFQFPSSYTDSFPSYFGSRRNYNNIGYDWYHNGLDLYGGVGTPIFAAAKGKVVYTGSLEIRGNVTYIDHGWGVFTGYLHQSDIEVSVGDWVEPGQQIGLVGATGRVTGPHLHWEIWVGGVPVDPLEWVGREFP